MRRVCGMCGPPTIVCGGGIYLGECVYIRQVAMIRQKNKDG